MKNFMNIAIVLVMLVVFSVVFPRKAHAYINPGAGTYILHLIISVLVGGLVAVKLYWNKVKTFFKNFFSKLRN